MHEEINLTFPDGTARLEVRTLDVESHALMSSGNRWQAVIEKLHDVVLEEQRTLTFDEGEAPT